MNYFAHQTAAERYAESRPYFHPIVINRIRNFLKLRAPIPFAVDVACGTGQSALALTEIANAIIACDVSSSMLSLAPAHERIRYVEAPAEQLPVPEESSDLMTVSLAFHWFDRSRFLAEAHRALKSHGTLVIYSNNFFGTTSENPEFARWNHDSYHTRYPVPPRNAHPFTDKDAIKHNFNFTGRESYTNEILFSPEELVNYLMTQSNVIARVEQGSEEPAEVYTWLLDSIHPLFPTAKATFKFGGEIWYLNKSP